MAHQKVKAPKAVKAKAWAVFGPNGGLVSIHTVKEHAMGWADVTTKPPCPHNYSRLAGCCIPCMKKRGYRCIRVQIPMSNDKETNGKLLTDADVERMKGDVQKWMREPEQWRQLLTHRFNSLLADRHARIEQNRKGIETMFEKMCELDTPKRGELHLLLISLFS